MPTGALTDAKNDGSADGFENWNPLETTLVPSNEHGAASVPHAGSVGATTLGFSMSELSSPPTWLSGIGSWKSPP